MGYQQFRAQLLDTYNDCCAWCGVHAGVPHPASLFTDAQYKRNVSLAIDHIKTKFDGGSDDIDNLQILCNRCNSVKQKWSLPRLPPRKPAKTARISFDLQQRLKDKIMPARRQSAQWIPRAQLGY